MKKLILASLALLLVCSAIPVMAGEKSIDSQEPATFQALSKLSGPGQVVLNKMSDEQLSKVEGERRFNFQFNYSAVSINQFAACLAICGNSANVFVVQSNRN
jgi:hypothetical protein